MILVKENNVFRWYVSFFSLRRYKTCRRLLCRINMTGMFFTFKNNLFTYSFSYNVQRSKLQYTGFYSEMNKASVTLLHSGNQSACNKLQKFLNVSSDISTHTIITCQDIFVPMSAFADHFYMLIQHISLLDSSNL